MKSRGAITTAAHHGGLCHVVSFFGLHLEWFLHDWQAHPAIPNSFQVKTVMVEKFSTWLRNSQAGHAKEGMHIQCGGSRYSTSTVGIYWVRTYILVVLL